MLKLNVLRYKSQLNFQNLKHSLMTHFRTTKKAKAFKIVKISKA